MTIADPLTMPQAQAIEATIKQIEGGENGKTWLSVVDGMQLPAVLACVEKWELSNFPANVTADTFPASPRADSHKLIAWLFAEVFKVYIGEAEIPNG